MIIDIQITSQPLGTSYLATKLMVTCIDQSIYAPILFIFIDKIDEHMPVNNSFAKWYICNGLLLFHINLTYNTLLLDPIGIIFWLYNKSVWKCFKIKKINDDRQLSQNI